MSLIKILLNGIFTENPILMLMIGLCPTLACSGDAGSALGMGLAATFVLVCSNLLVSMIRRIVPSEIRIPVFIVIIATFVTITDYTMQAYFPQLATSLGVFLPLIVVNCIILARAEAFAYRNNLIRSFFDGLGMGLGFTLAIVLLGIMRETIGAGTIFGYPLNHFEPAAIMILPPGAFIGIGILISIWQIITKKKKEVSPCHNCALAKICYPEGKGEL